MATENLAIGDVSKQPVCVDKSGKIVPLTGTVGANVADAVQPIYMLNGEIVKIDKNVGASNRPIFMEGGVLKPIAGPIGTASKPVYVNSDGQIVPLSGNAGGSTDKKPLKLVNGVLTPVAAELATAADVESARAEAKKLLGREIFYDGTWVFLNYNKHRLYTGVESMAVDAQKITSITDGMFGVSGQSSRGERWYTFRRQNGAWEGQRGIVADFVTSIANYAFYDTNYLSQMYCPLVKTIGKMAFMNADMITFSRFYMPLLEKIGDYGFQTGATTDMWESNNMYIVYFPKLRYMGYRSFYNTYYIREFNVGMKHVITTTDADRTAIKNFVLNNIPANYTEGIRNLNSSNANQGDQESAPLYKERFKAMVDAGRISVCDMWRTDPGICVKLNFPTMQFFMYMCCYNYRKVTSINIKEAILIDYQAFMYLSYDKPSSPLYIDIQKCLYIGRDAFEDAYISGIRADELVRIGYSAFEMHNAPGQGSFQHLYAPKLQIIDATGCQYCYGLKDSKYSEDGGSTWIGTNDTIELPECRWIKQNGLWGHNAVTIKLPKCTKLGDAALYDHTNQRLRHVYLDAMDASTLVANQLEAPTADDRGIYYSINGGSRPNVTIHCKNGKTVKWNTSTSRWYVAS